MLLNLHNLSVNCDIAFVNLAGIWLPHTRQTTSILCSSSTPSLFLFSRLLSSQTCTRSASLELIQIVKGITEMLRRFLLRKPLLILHIWIFFFRSSSNRKKWKVLYYNKWTALRSGSWSLHNLHPSVLTMV